MKEPQPAFLIDGRDRAIALGIMAAMLAFSAVVVVVIAARGHGEDKGGAATNGCGR